MVGPTHTLGDTGFFVTGDNVLFSGDVVMNKSFLAATAVSSARAWMTAFDTFEAMKPTAVVPSHGGVGNRLDHRRQPRNREHGADSRARTEGAGPLGRRGGHDHSAGASSRASGVAARQRHPGARPLGLCRGALTAGPPPLEPG